MTEAFVPPYSWQVDKERSQDLLKGSHWLPQYKTSIECSTNFPTIVGMFIGMPNFQGQDMKNAILNALRRPWRAFAYNLVDSLGNPIATEKVFLDYLSANPSIEVTLSPKEWIAKNITFPYNGTEYPTDFFTPLGADLIRMEMNGLYTLKTTTGTLETYVAGRELYKKTALINNGDPFSNAWIDNTYYFETQGANPDDVFTTNVVQMSNLFSDFGNLGVYFPFNFQLDLPQTSGYVNVKTTLQITLNVQNVYLRSNWFYCDFPIDEIRAPNSYSVSDLDFSMIRSTHAVQVTNSCVGLINSINHVTSPFVITAGITLQQLIFTIAEVCQTQRISQMYDAMSNLKLKVQTCQKYLGATNNRTYEQSEGFLQLLDLITETKNAVSDIQKINPNLPNITTWNDVFTYQFNTKTLQAEAGQIYSEKLASMKRPLYVEGNKKQKKLDQTVSNIVSANQSTPIIFLVVVVALLTFLFFLSLGFLVHLRWTNRRKPNSK